MEKRELPLGEIFLCCHLPLTIFKTYFFGKVAFLQVPGKYCCSVASTVKKENQMKVEVTH